MVGLAVNAISDAYPGAAAPAVGAAAFFVVLVAIELRRLPSRAPVQRLVTRACLVGAAIAAIGSVLAAAAWTGWLVLIAATLGTASCVVPAPYEVVLRQLRAVAVTGIGVGAIGLGFDALALLHYAPVLAVSPFTVGSALMAIGIADLRSSHRLGGAAFAAAGVAVAISGVGAFQVSHTLDGIALIGMGVTMTFLGAALIRRSRQLAGIGCYGVGLTVIASGVGDILSSQIPRGVAFVGIGAMIVAGWRAIQSSSEHLFGIAVIGMGMPFVVFGVGELWAYGPLIGVASIGLGLAVVGLGVAVLRHTVDFTVIRSMIAAPTDAEDEISAGAPDGRSETVSRSPVKAVLDDQGEHIEDAAQSRDILDDGR